ncbi:MAG TPA: c-type cytochrome domain-containing protein [Humisphaera sp.]|nr:c-type cytochrome domain-containing protein [Humisphaera sp.]
MGFTALSRADDGVSYFRDVRPIFVGNCNSCHKPEKLKGELDMTSVALLAKGGKHGPAVVGGNPARSKLIEMISGDDPDMPQDGDPLKPQQIALIARWIQQGAKDDTPKPGQMKIEPPKYAVPPVVTSIAYSPDGQLLAVTGYHEVLLHKSDGSAIVARLTGEAPRVESVVFSSDGKFLADCGGAPSEFGLVQLWNVATRKLAGAWQVSGDSLYGISFAPDEKSVAFGGADKVVHRLNLADGREMLDFKAHADWVLGTLFTLDGKQLVSASRDRELKLIDLENSRFIDDINNPLEGCISIARNPKAEQVIYGGDLGGARIYKISDNQGRTSGRIDTNLIRAFEKQPGPVTAVAWSPDGNSVALGSIGVAQIYSVKDGTRTLSLSGHKGPIFAIAFKPDGSTIATAGYDGMIRLFDARSGNLVKQFLSVPIDPPATQPTQTVRASQ